MAEYEYIDPRTKMPFRVVTGDKVPEAQVRAWAKANAPAPRKSPLDQTPILSMPTPFAYTDDSVWSSPKGPLGPGVIANTLSRIMQGPPGSETITPDLVYKELNKGLIKTGEAAASFLPGGKLTSTLLRRMLTQGGISAGGEALAGGTPEQVLEHGAFGAGTQGALEGLFRGATLLPYQKIAQILRGKHAAGVEQAAEQTAQNAKSMSRFTENQDLVRAMDERNIQAATEPILAKHATETAQVKAQNAAAARGHEEGLQAKKQADRQANIDWAQETQRAQAAQKMAMQQHAEQGATQIMEDAKQAIPWWQELTSDGKGYLDAIIGKGQDLLSAGYDAAMQAAKGTARGTRILIPMEDAKALRVRGQTPSPKEILTGSQSSERLIRAPGTDEGGTVVDAADLIERVTRMGKKRDWDLYHRTVELLSDADIGIDQAARESYKHGMGVITSADANAVLKFDPVSKTRYIDPDAMIEGMLKVEKANILRNRGMGDLNTSPILQALEGSPAAPVLPAKPIPEVSPLAPAPRPEPAKPEVPEMPDRGPLNPKARSEPQVVEPPAEPEIGTTKLPGDRYGRGAALGGALGILGGLFGGTHGGGVGGATGLGGGTALGYGLGRMLPDEVVTSIPAFENLLRQLLYTAGSGVRTLTEEPEGTQTTLTPAQEAEIQAAIAARTGQDPRLQLDINAR